MSAPGFRDEVLIGICTFRRPELAALEGLESCGLPVAIAVADNDRAPDARQIEIYGTAPGRTDSALRPGPGGS